MKTKGGIEDTQSPYIFLNDKMVLRIPITGKVKCECERSKELASKVLDKHKIKHKCECDCIKFDDTLNVSPMFNKQGFINMLYAQLRRHGKVNINL